MSVPEVYHSEKSGAFILVNTALSAVLNESVFRNVRHVEVAFNEMSNAYVFKVMRMDLQTAQFDVPHPAFGDFSLDDTVAAFRRDPEMLARLILFLA